MIISRVDIEGFRNFAKESIFLDRKTLVIGANDSGKTNFLYALRLLLDPTFGSSEFELDASDYNVETGATEVCLTVYLEQVVEPCLISVFGGRLRDGMVVLRFTSSLDGDYSFYTGPDITDLEPTNARYYCKHLCLEYVGGRREAPTYLKRQQSSILELAKLERSEVEVGEDDRSVCDIQQRLEFLNSSIGSLHYVSNSMNIINKEMSNISADNEGYEARLVAGNTDAGKLLSNLQLSYMQGGNPLTFGGDGRSNQLFFATWLSQHKIKQVVEKVKIFAIEEPEAHLHPHQQRRLAKYLSGQIEEQVILTTHSPQIVERFVFDSFIRLYADRLGSRSVCSDENVASVVEDMGYRINAIVAEVFFCKAVLLVEGPSEKTFYMALSEALEIDLDRLNVSVLSVDGVGFEPYVACCSALGIPWVLRTDNDLIKVKGREEYRLAGFERALAVSALSGNLTAQDAWNGEGLNGRRLESLAIPEDIQASLELVENELEKVNIFLSEKDLEHDLIAGALRTELAEYYEEDGESLYRAMTTRKAENMHRFVSECESLGCVSGERIEKPLSRVVSLALNG